MKKRTVLKMVAADATRVDFSQGTTTPTVALPPFTGSGGCSPALPVSSSGDLPRNARRHFVSWFKESPTALDMLQTKRRQTLFKNK
jgi:hypothetical protein